MALVRAASIAAAQIELRLGVAAKVEDLHGFDEVVIATGVVPRDIALAGQERALSYIEVLQGAPVGPRVAVIGAGGIGFDALPFDGVALFVGGQNTSFSRRNYFALNELVRKQVGKKCLAPVLMTRSRAQAFGKGV